MIASPTMINPLSGRKIKIGTRTYKRVIKLRNNIFDFNAIVKQQLQNERS